MHEPVIVNQFQRIEIDINYIWCYFGKRKVDQGTLLVVHVDLRNLS